MRRVAPIVLALLGAAFAPRAARAQEIPVGPGGQLTSVVGVPFYTPIIADMTLRTEKIGSFAARLSWNPAVLQFDALINGTFGVTTANTDSLNDGVLRLAGINPAGAGGMVTLGTLRFTPLIGDTTTLVMSLSELYAAGTFANLRPSALVTNRLFCPAGGLYGDINQDGFVNSLDALIAVSNAVGLNVGNFAIPLGDVDGNGVTDTRDALIILSYAVGIDVTSFRIGLLAGGACAAGGAIAMSITPVPVDIVRDQTVQLEARAAVAGGALQTLRDVTWRSSDVEIADVDADGLLSAYTAGSVVITALRGANDSAQATITVLASRTRHVVDAAAVNATNQIGTAALPFGTTAQALDFAQAGDTIELRPGRYQGPVDIGADIVLLGDTLLDGTRPTIFGVGDPFLAGSGVYVYGLGPRRIVNVGFENLWNAVEIDGPDNVLLRGLRSQGVENGIVTDAVTASVRVEKGRIIGRGVENFDSDAIQMNYHVDTLVIEDTEIGDFGRSGVYAPDVDSVAIARSNIHDLSYYGLELGRSCSGAQFHLTMENSTLQRSGSTLMYLEDLGSAVFTNNVLRVDERNLVYQNQCETSGGFIAFHGDSIYNSDDNWLTAYDLDSVTVDSVRAVLPSASGYIYNTPYVRVRGGYFRDVSNSVFQVYVGGGGFGGGVVDVRNTSFTGDPRCDLCADAVYTQDARTTVDSVDFTNVNQAVQTNGDSSLTVTNSTFRRVEYGVQFYGNYFIGCPTCSPAGLTMRNNTINGFYTGVTSYYGPVTIEDNTFVAGQSEGIDAFGYAAQSVQRNVFDDVNYSITLTLNDTSVTGVVADNIVTRGGQTAIRVNGDNYADTVRMHFDVLRNQVQCITQFEGDVGVDVGATDAVVADNVIAGCFYGVYLSQYGASTKDDSILRNTITLPGISGGGGVYAEGTTRTRISNNVITGDSSAYLSNGLIFVQGYYYYGYRATTLIDSNTISLSKSDGISVEYVDTAVVAANSIQDVQQDGIRLMYGLKYFAAAQGNTIRRAAGSGVLVYDYSGDTTTMQVDSNTISGSGTGIDFEYGNGLLTRNTITGSLNQGIYLSPYINFGGGIALNNISGNAFGLRDNSEGSYAINNWWGDDRGPRCASDCDPATLGDSVSNSWAVFPWLLAPNASSPPPAPRALATTAARAPRVVASRALPAPEAAMPPARTAAPVRPARRQPAAFVAAPRIPAGLPAARAERLAARQQQRIARGVASAAAAARIEGRLEAERATLEQARTAQAARVAQARAAVRARPTAGAPTPQPAPTHAPARRP